MIPIRDNIPSRRTPYVNYIIIGINVAVFIMELNVQRYLPQFFMHFGIVPIRYSVSHIAERYTFMEQVIPFFSSMFLHGGWLHLIGNMWTLYIFGDNVEDVLGHGKYLVFYIICGLAAGLFHLITNWTSQIPTVGASGAIAGIMGAYFMLYPHARVLVIVPIFLFMQLIEIPAFVFLGFWFFIQFFNGALSIRSAQMYGGVAWWAHIGGFIVGLYLINILLNRRRRRYRVY